MLRWALLALVVYWVGAKLLKTPETNSTWSEVARVTGFAQAPGLLMLFHFIPFLGGLISVLVVIWTFVATVVAVRQALDYRSTLRALVVVLIGGIVGAFGLVFLFALVPRESVF